MFQKKILIVGLTFLLISVSNPALVLIAHAENGIPVITTPPNQNSPLISGKYIIYLDDRNHPGTQSTYADLFVYDINQKKEVNTIKYNAPYKGFDLDKNFLVWDDLPPGTTGSDYRTYILDLAKNTRSEIPFKARYPKISGNYVLYQRSPNVDLYLYDLVTKKEIPLPYDKPVTVYAIDGNKVVWGEYWGYPDSSVKPLVLYTINDLNNLALNKKEILVSSKTFGQRYYSLDISGNNIVYTKQPEGDTQSRTFAYNITTKSEKKISDVEAAGIKIHGDLAVWAVGGASSNLFVSDLSMNTLTQLTSHGKAYSPDIFERKIVWQDFRNGVNYDIYAYEYAKFIRGDVNNDGKVDFSDSIYFNGWFNNSAYPAPACLDTADINDDGAVDISDVSLFPSAVYGTYAISAPYPQAGTDPTLDTLPCK